VTPAEHEARISRYQVLMENAVDERDLREQQTLFLAAVMARNAERTADQVAKIEHERGLRR
jgi:hypothetical protein